MRKASLRVCVALSVVGAATVLSGCSGGSEASSDFCKSVASLDAAVAQINQNYLTKSSVAAVESSMAALGTSLENLSQSAGSQMPDEVKAVEAAGEQLDTTVSAAVDQPVPHNMNAARTSMRDFSTAVNDLAKSTSETC